MMTANPPAYRQLVGAALRRYRENLGWALEDAALILECDRSKISRVETGQRGIQPKELQELLGMYGVSKDEQTALLAIVRADREVPRRDAHHDEMPDAYLQYLILESAATQILCYEPLRVPELIQTPDFAKAFGHDWAVPNRRRLLAVRRPRLTVLITEQALRNTADDRTVIRDQVRALAEIGTAYSHITLHVLCTARSAASGGPATILRFANASSLGAAYLPGMPGQGGACLVSPDQVADCIRAFEALRMDALDADESAKMLWKLANSHRG